MKGVWEGIGRSDRQGEGREGVLVVQQGRGEGISIGGRCGSEPTGLLPTMGEGVRGSLLLSRGKGTASGLVS